MLQSSGIDHKYSGKHAGFLQLFVQLVGETLSIEKLIEGRVLSSKNSFQTGLKYSVI
jgi:hypothetical protein